MNNVNITHEGITVQVGQKWRDLDVRSEGRIITITEVLNGKVRVTSNISATKSTISVKRLRKSSTGYALV